MIIHYHYVQRDRGTITILSLCLHFLFFLKFKAIISHIISHSLFFCSSRKPCVVRSNGVQARPVDTYGYVFCPSQCRASTRGTSFFFLPRVSELLLPLPVHGLDLVLPDIISIVVGKWNNPEYGASRMKSFNFFQPTRWSPTPIVLSILLFILYIPYARVQ